LARARLNIGSLMRGSCSLVNVLKQRKNKNRRNQSHERAKRSAKTTLPHTHQFFTEPPDHAKTKSPAELLPNTNVRGQP